MSEAFLRKFIHMFSHRAIQLHLFLLVLTGPSYHLAPAEATGFVRTEKIDGIWWFIDPDGERFVSLGVNHIEPHLWLAPYNREQTLERYGGDFVNESGRFNTSGTAAKRWIDRQVEHCRDLGFNTFAKHTHPAIDSSLYRDHIYYIVSLETAPLAGWRERHGEGPRPDIFSLDFEHFLEGRVKELCLPHRDSRNLLGYIYTDIPNWRMGRADQKAKDEFVLIYPWINALLSLGESSPGKMRWIEHLKDRYPNAEAAAKIWGLPVSPSYGISWERMARLNDWGGYTDEATAKSDQVSFMYQIADQWYRLHKETIRQHDPNHLLFGDKNILQWHYEWVIPALKKHVDVIATQSYGRWAVDARLNAALYEQIGKPIFNGDGSFGLAHPQQQQQGVKGFRTGAESVEEVATLYRETLTGMMSTPYIIGWHHCGYIQQWDTAERGDSPRNENGFLDPFENYDTQWTDVIRETNLEAAKLHGKANKEH